MYFSAGCSTVVEVSQIPIWVGLRSWRRTLKKCTLATYSVPITYSLSGENMRYLGSLGFI